MPNGIYLYLYQNAQTEVELIPFEPREDHVGRKYLSIGVFVPQGICAISPSIARFRADSIRLYPAASGINKRRCNYASGSWR